MHGGLPSSSVSSSCAPLLGSPKPCATRCRASVDGEYLVYFGAWKHHIGLYPIPPLAAELEGDVGPYRAATDTVRFRYKDPVPWDIVERLIAELVRRLTADA